MSKLREARDEKRQNRLSGLSVEEALRSRMMRQWGANAGGGAGKR